MHGSALCEYKVPIVNIERDLRCNTDSTIKLAQNFCDMEQGNVEYYKCAANCSLYKVLLLPLHFLIQLLCYALNQSNRQTRALSIN